MNDNKRKTTIAHLFYTGDTDRQTLSGFMSFFIPIISNSIEYIINLRINRFGENKSPNRDNINYDISQSIGMSRICLFGPTDYIIIIPPLIIIIHLHQFDYRAQK